jgi:hypothetical protein
LGKSARKVNIKCENGKTALQRLEFLLRVEDEKLENCVDFWHLDGSEEPVWRRSFGVERNKEPKKNLGNGHRNTSVGSPLRIVGCMSLRSGSLFVGLSERSLVNHHFSFTERPAARLKRIKQANENQIEFFRKVGGKEATNQLVIKEGSEFYVAKIYSSQSSDWGLQ